MRGHSFEVARLPVVYDAFGLADLLVVAGRVSAAHADAVLIAQAPLCKALAVELQAVNLGAFAARVGVLPRGQVELAYQWRVEGRALMMLFVHGRHLVE